MTDARRSILPGPVSRVDLTDPSHGSHPLQVLARQCHEALVQRSPCRRPLLRPGPVVARAGAGAVARRCLSDAPETLLDTFSLDPPDEALLVAMAPVDAPGRPEAHDLEMIRITRSVDAGILLADLVQALARSVFPLPRYRLLPTTRQGAGTAMRIDAAGNGVWETLGDCGILTEDVLWRCGLDPETYSAVALGIQLDRLWALRPEGSESVTASAVG